MVGLPGGLRPELATGGRARDLGPGVTGTIGAFARPDGSLQVTYDGHPLYTTTTDTGPGQAKGDGVWSHGGEWHEVTVPDRGG